ncbi:platelet-activating factor acetylhydrolase [Umbelopsis sp. PMI_123]|nr:platelet-activating factor acetylhydrolase [Umbelopsis sp. PMI_123]
MPILASFPELMGRYAVACHDINYTCLGSLDGFDSTSISSDNSNTTKVESMEFTHPGVHSVFVRIFYPTTVSKTKQFAKSQWLPSHHYGRALCDLVGLPKFIAKLLAACATLKRTHFYTDAPLSNDEDAYPVVIFSHGLGGNRLIYSTLCSQLASHGLIVFAIEHRDRSGSLALGTDEEWIHFHRPHKEDWDAFKDQIAFRTAEVQICLELAQEINTGKQQCLKTNPVLYDFCNRLDLQNMIMAGHSFGGATAALVLRNTTNPFRCGILFDAWVQPIMDKDGCNKPLTRPILGISSEEFVNWPQNFDLLQQLFSEVAPGVTTTLTSVVGSDHQAQSDIPLVLRHLMRFDIRFLFHTCPTRTLHINCMASIEFLRCHLYKSDEKKYQNVQSWKQCMPKNELIFHQEIHRL